jgi:hypothetical protein
MKALNREKMIAFLEKKGCRVVGETEQFNGSVGGIWLSGEEGDGLFEYYSSSPRFTFGVLDTLNQEVSDRGWWFEWNDAGTIMCWEY